MKKLSKLMALLLSLFMIASLFTACGDDNGSDKKEESAASETKEKLTGKDLLLGKWNVTSSSAYMSTDIEIDLEFNFKEDGNVKGYLSEANYNKMIEKLAEIVMQQFGADASDKEAKNNFIQMIKEESPYEEAASTMENCGTWELEGDTLTIDGGDGEPMVIETKLSEGVDNFEYSDEENTMTFKKAN